jgi:hypothetical protein
MAVQYAGNEDISGLIEQFTRLTAYTLEIRGNTNRPGLFPDLIENSTQSLVETWDTLSGLKIVIPSFLSSFGFHPKQTSRYSGCVQPVVVPDCELRPAVWTTEPQRLADAATMNCGIGITNMQKRSNRPLQRTVSDFDGDAQPRQGPSKSIQVQLPPPKIELTTPQRKFTPGELARLIQATPDIAPPPDDDEPSVEEFLPKMDPDKIVTHHKQLDLSALKGRTVEDRFLSEWEAVQRAPVGKDGQKKLSEGRVMTLLDGTMDDPISDDHKNDEMVELQRLSVHLQSLIYSEIASQIRLDNEKSRGPETIRNTEVAILVDISSSMTTLSKEKLISSQILCAGIGSVLSCFGVSVKYFAFGDREAIWSLSRDESEDPSAAILRVVDALRTGNRPGSCPLDGLMTAYHEWDKSRNTSVAVERGSNHLSIVISDFISAQVFDTNRDWSSEYCGQCILISLKTALDRKVLDAHKVPPDVYINGILPKITKASVMKGFSIDPAELLPQGTHAPESESVRAIITEILRRLISKSPFTSQPRPVKFTTRRPLATNPSRRIEPVWLRQDNICENRETSGESVNFFFQLQPVQGFPLFSLAISGNPSQVQVPEQIESPREWIEQRVATLACPFVGISQGIATAAFNPSMKPNVASGKEPSASSGELWIDGLRRFISSGFTYPYLFRKKSRRNQKAYSITIVIDNVCRLFAQFNSAHMIGTTAAILGAFPVIPDSDDIVIDIIAVSDERAHLLVHDLPVRHLSEAALINDVIRTAQHCAGYESGIGIGVQAALQLAARRSGIGSARRIIAITDGIVTTPGQILALKSTLIECAVSGIDVLGIGVGLAPVHLQELFPVALYCPNPIDLDRGLAAALDVSGRVTPTPITPRELFSLIENVNSVIDLLSGAPRLCSSLRSQICSQPLSLDFMEVIGDTDLLFMKGRAKSLSQNPKAEPYHDGVFQGFQILIVCLYMGANEKNNRITKSVFDSQCGVVLRAKGFTYKFVCSYGEGIIELQRVEDGNCPYSQLWLFSSEGYGDLPKEAMDTSKDKVLPFLAAVAEFWQNGGGLLMFCDNHPYDFEANYLLENLLIFTRDDRTLTHTQVQFGGNYAGKTRIRVAESENPTVGKFIPKVELPPPGRASRRISLRPGLIEIYEGDTISYAVNKSGTPLCDTASLWPFTPFAWTSENVSPPRPFILFHDPVIPPGAPKSPGPIVLHGGFTSAFYEFGDDRLGTGRLIVSIAAWLTRIEERLYTSKLESRSLVTGIPRLTGNYVVTGIFNRWRSPPAPPRHSILILDGSGSMNNYYSQLIVAVNAYINIQVKAGGLISVVWFGTNAGIIYEQGTRTLRQREGYTGGGTNFCAALQAALPIIRRNPPGYVCRIVFFTDGCPDAFPTKEIKEVRHLNIRLDPVGFGKINRDVLTRMASCGGTVSENQTMQEVEQTFIRIAASS